MHELDRAPADELGQLPPEQGGGGGVGVEDDRDRVLFHMGDGTRLRLMGGGQLHEYLGIVGVDDEEMHAVLCPQVEDVHGHRLRRARLQVHVEGHDGLHEHPLPGLDHCELVVRGDELQARAGEQLDLVTEVQRRRNGYGTRVGADRHHQHVRVALEQLLERDVDHSPSIGGKAADLEHSRQQFRDDSPTTTGMSGQIGTVRRSPPTSTAPSKCSAAIERQASSSPGTSAGT